MHAPDLPLPATHPAPNFPPGQGSYAPHASSLRELCELLRIKDQVDCGLEAPCFEHIHVRTGHRVHLIGQACDRLYVVVSGLLKTVMPPRHGREQIVDFPMRGDLLGTEGIACSRHTLEAVALTPCELVVAPRATLSDLGRRHAELIAALCGVMARGLTRDQLLIGARAGLCTHARMARFLLYIAQRQADCGYSSGNVALRMQRMDIASYLGMAPETVSRTMATLEAQGLIAIGRDNIWLKEPATLRTLRRLPRCGH